MHGRLRWKREQLGRAEQGGWGLTLPQTLVADAAWGLVFLLVLPFLPHRKPAAQ